LNNQKHNLTFSTQLFKQTTEDAEDGAALPVAFFAQVEGAAVE